MKTLVNIKQSINLHTELIQLRWRFCCNFTPQLIIMCWGYFRVEKLIITRFISQCCYVFRYRLPSNVFSLWYVKTFLSFLYPPFCVLCHFFVTSLPLRCLRLWPVHHHHLCQCRPGGDRKPDTSLPVCLPTKLHRAGLPVHHAVHRRAPCLHREPTDCHVST